MNYKDRNRIIESLSGELNHRKYIDLGLSVMWAATNIGAIRCEDFGNLFTWGAIVDFGRDIMFDRPKPSEELLQMESICNTKFDAATQTWGVGWRLPTFAELEELCFNCECTYHIFNGIPGIIFTSKVNSNSIFLPLAGSGYRDQQGTRESVYGLGAYWSGNPCSKNPGEKFAPYLDLMKREGEYNTHYYLGGSSNIMCAHSIRPVTSAVVKK